MLFSKLFITWCQICEMSSYPHICTQTFTERQTVYKFINLHISHVVIIICNAQCGLQNEKQKCLCEMDLISVGVNYHDTIIKIYEFNNKKKTGWVDELAWQTCQRTRPYLIIIFVRCARSYMKLLIHLFILSFQLKSKNIFLNKSKQASRQLAS